MNNVVRQSCIGAIIAVTTFAATAAEGDAESSQHKLEVAPVVIDSEDGAGSTIGLEFDISGDLLSASKPTATSDTDEFESPEKVLIKQYNVHYEAKGVVTADAERNPLNYIDAVVDGRILWNAPSGTFIGAAFLRYETDQSMDDHQSEYGLRGTYTRLHLLRENDQLGIDLKVGEVDPKQDQSREAALGTTTLEKFYRWSGEFLYMLPLSSDGMLRDLEINYRYYLEDDPPDVIKAANLDTYSMATIRLGLKGGLFVAYSTGTLPFDQESDRIYAIGFSYQLN